MNVKSLVGTSVRAGMFLGIIGIVAATTGCSIPISVKYTPVGATESLVESGNTPHVFVGQFEDARSGKEEEYIGDMKNLFGGSAKKVTTSDDVRLLFAEAATDALRKGGAEASLHGERTATSTVPPDELRGFDYILGGRIKTISVESQPGWDTFRITAKVVIDVYVKRGDKGEWLGPIEGTAETRETMLHTESLTSVLDTAIGNCMRNMIRHLKSSGILATSKSS
jgi:hypothetical protein